MSDTCNHNCSECSSNGECSKEKLNENSSVKKVIAVVSGKGGVGKSLVSGLIAVELNRRGKKVGIIDADITGPSIPKMFGIHDSAYESPYGILPAESENGIKVMSLNLLVEKEDTPVFWRGPVLAGTVKQFWSDVYWDELDYLLIDMPPGTGDIPLTVYQSLPIDGIVIVTSPQDLVSLIVKKAYNMATAMNVPILGFVENYSYVTCPDCGKKFSIFGESKLDEISKELGVKVLDRLPIDSLIAKACDEGLVESVRAGLVDGSIKEIESLE